ncbi:MAG: insulinase family protein [Magnetococcales bacterium]|nr:insulinase family protein [Magnetococcales bacterium]
MKWWIIVGMAWLMGWAPISESAALTEARFFQTRNGIRVYLLENHAHPMVEMRLLTRGGSVFDPVGKEGVAFMTAWMFNEGAGDMDAESFRDRLDYFGIVMNGDAKRDTLEVSLTTLAGHVEEAVRLLALRLTQPRFATHDFERGLQETIVNLKQNQEHASWRAAMRLYDLMYRGHPYSHPPSGTLAGMARVTRNDVRQFHVKSFRAPQMVLAVAGDVTEETLKTILERYLGDVDPRPTPHGAIPRVSSEGPGKVVTIPMTILQTAIEMGVVAMDREDPDYYPMVVMTQVFGGPGLTSRLHEEIREKRGLTYGVHATFMPLEARGPFVISMKTKTESSTEAIRLIRKEMTRLVEDGIGDEELADVKRYLTGSFALNFDTLKKQASIWGAIGYYRRGLDYVRRWPERIRGVSAADVQRVARRILDPKSYFCVTAGKPVSSDKHAPSSSLHQETK